MTRRFSRKMGFFLAKSVQPKLIEFSQSITQSQLDTESSLGPDRSPSNPPTPSPTNTPGVHVLSNGEVKELEFRELVDEMTRPKVDLSLSSATAAPTTARADTPTEVSIGPLGDSYSNFEDFRSRRSFRRTLQGDEDTEVKRPLLLHPQHEASSVQRPAHFATPLDSHSTAPPPPPPPLSSFTLPPGAPSSSHARPPLQRIPTIGLDPTVGENPGLCAFLLTIISVVLIIVTLPFSMFLCIKVVQEYERAVIFRLGRLVKGGAKGPGIFFIIPCIDSYCKVDLRTVSFDVPPQEILSRDSVTVAVDAVVYYRISNATVAVSNVEDYGRSTRLLAATTLRNVLGTKDLSQILSERESISHVMQSSLDEATDPWGVKVERVEIKDVRLPVQLQRAMAAEAEAAREARAKVIAAEGEQRASKALKEAAEVMTHNPAALQLRYLQTLSSIAGEKNSTIVFPIPMELFRSVLKPERTATPQPPPPPPQSMA